MTDGLKDAHREAIIATIAANDRVERAVLFGSRATGTNTVSSDVDIALFGDRLTLTDQAQLAAALDEIPMAQSVDLLLYDSIRNRTLQAHIRNHGVEWFARPSECLRGEWTQHRLVDLCDITRGASPRPIHDWIATSGIPWVKIADATATASRYIEQTRERIRCEGRSNSVTVIPGDLILSNSASPGIPKFMNIEACIHDGWLLLRNFRGLDRLFAYYLLLYERDALVGKGTGSVFTNLKTEILKQHGVTVPKVGEQHAIAHILGTLDDKIELNRRMNATLEAMARALFRSWFVDFDPVRAKMKGRDTGLPKDLADLFPARLVDSELGEIPEGWPLVPLPELMEINPPRALRRGTIAPYLDMANMPTSGHAPDSVVVRPFGSGMRFANGDTLVARITPCLENGKTAYVDFLRDDEIGWGSTEYIVMKPKHPLPSEFAYFLARSARFREFAIRNMSGTSGRQRVPATALAGFSIPSPPPRISVEFGRAAQLLLGRAKSAVDDSRVLGDCRDTLLPRLVSGELRVNTPEPACRSDDRPALVEVHGA